MNKQAFLDGYMGKEADYSDVPVSKLYDALSEVETGSWENPWRRTSHMPPGGSSAYGPVQIGLKSEDLVDSGTPYYNPDLQDEANRYLDHRDKLLYHGDEEDLPDYDPRYDYSTRKDLTQGVGDYYKNRRLQEEYKKIAHWLIKRDWERSKGDIDEFSRRWYSNTSRSGSETHKRRLRAALERVMEGAVPRNRETSHQPTRQPARQPTRQPARSSSERFVPTSPGTKVHTVRQGDTAWDIARDAGITVDDVKRLNPHIEDLSRIRPGQEVRVR